MIVAFDASVLVYLFNKDANAPIDLATNEVVPQCAERLEFLLATLHREKAKIIIPTPALAEVLVKAQEGAAERLKILSSSRQFVLAPFDVLAAVEHAAMQIQRIGAGRIAKGSARAKAKFDDQIIAIARVHQASIIYSDDPDIRQLAQPNIEVVGISGLPLPAESAQGDWLKDLGQSKIPPGGASLPDGPAD